MLKLIAKPGCKYCEVFKDYFDQAEINYEIVKPQRGDVVPTVKLGNEIIFIGLPHISELMRFINEEI